MKTALTALLLTAILAFSSGSVMAEEKVKKEPTVAQLQAKLHRARAALLEARAAEKPDRGRIAALNREIQDLRQRLAGKNAAPGVQPAGCRRCCGCPFAGAGRGPGGGWGRGGFGRGSGYIDADGNGVCDRREGAVGVKP